MNLRNYFNKRVRLTDEDMRVTEGVVVMYTPAIDNPDNIDSIALKVDDTDRVLHEFEESEITRIEIVSATAQSMAVAV